MDTLLFDRLIRALVSTRKHRVSGRQRLAIVAAFGSSLFAPSAVARKKKKKKKKPAVPCVPPPPPPPPPEPTCAESCHGACEFCFVRAAGPLLCGGLSGGAQPCSVPCFSDSACVGTNHPYCVTHLEVRATGVRSDACPEPGGWCFSVAQCS